MRAEESLAALIAALPKCDKCPATATRSVFEGGTYCDEHGTNWDPSMIHDLSYADEYRKIAAVKVICKFVIMHPSDRPLGLNYANKEVWGAEEPLLFDTLEEAQSLVDERSKQYPNSDWLDALIFKYTPGHPRICGKWDYTDLRIKPIKFEDMNQRQKDEESAKGYVGGGRHEPGGMLDPNAKDE